MAHAEKSGVAEVQPFKKKKYIYICPFSCTLPLSASICWKFQSTGLWPLYRLFDYIQYEDDFFSYDDAEELAWSLLKTQLSNALTLQERSCQAVHFAHPLRVKKFNREMLQREQDHDGKINGQVSLALPSRHSLSCLTDGFYYFTISNVAL